MQSESEMRLHGLFWLVPSSRRQSRSQQERHSFQQIEEQAPTLGDPLRLHTLALPVIIGSRTPMPRTANLGRRIARRAGE